MAKIPKNLSDKDMFKGWQEAPTIEETFREKILLERLWR